MKLKSKFYKIPLSPYKKSRIRSIRIRSNRCYRSSDEGGMEMESLKLGLFLVLALLLCTATVAMAAFQDTEEHWAEELIARWAKQGGGYRRIHGNGIRFSGKRVPQQEKTGPCESRSGLFCFFFPARGIQTGPGQTGSSGLLAAAVWSIRAIRGRRHGRGRRWSRGC